MNPIAQSALSFPTTGVNLDLKIIVWNILIGAFMAFIVFFILTKNKKETKTQNKSKSVFKLALITVFLTGFVGVGYYFLLLPQLQPNLYTVGFPSTGSDPNPEAVVASIKNLYTTPIDGLITLSLLILTVFLFVAVFRNIKRGKAIDKAKTEFVSLASHQLRTPLTAISWYTEMILNGDVGQVTPEQKKYLEEIYQGNRRMVELVNTLLDVSRIELGTFRIEPKMTDIIALAHSVLLEQKTEIEKKKLAIIENFSSNVPTFSTDPKLLRMVFQNLLANSVKYTPSYGRIEFSISFDDKKTILIKISDTGYGIPRGQQSRIFTKLFRADNVREKDTSGTGLGLYIVKSIIENSGGKIWFESQEDKGTTFYVTLPVEGIEMREEKKNLP